MCLWLLINSQLANVHLNEVFSEIVRKPTSWDWALSVGEHGAICQNDDV